MIKIDKNAEPAILAANKADWTQALLDRIRLRGGYSHLNDDDKKNILNNYNNPDVKTALRTTKGYAKCIYCESHITTGDPNVEHFKPKSIYPGLTFEWDNLYYACIKCNRPKDNYDTGINPFINPAIEDPEEFLTFDHLCIEPRYLNGPNRLKACCLIEKCDLERDELLHDYAQIEESFCKSIAKLKVALGDYNRLVRNNAKVKRATKILSFIDELKSKTGQEPEFAGFLRQLIRSSKYIKQAIDVINNHLAELGLHAPYDWGWNFNIPATY